jgi:hypothetical protein
MGIVFLIPVSDRVDSGDTSMLQNGANRADSLSVSMLLYGTTKYWNHVKEEHYWFFREVLLDEEHPRHAMYSYFNGMQQGSSNNNLGKLCRYRRYGLLCTQGLHTVGIG